MRGKYAIQGLMAAALLCGAAVCRAATAPAASTAAPAAVQSPMVLSVSKDSRRFRVELAYVVKWDFKDVTAIRPRSFYSGITSYSWATVENAKFTFYGITTTPLHAIIVKQKESSPAGSSPGGPAGPAGPRAGGSGRLSLIPLVHDLTSNLNAKLGTFLLNTSMKNTQWGSMGAENRNALVHDVLAMPVVWEAPVPLLGTAKQELEYVSKPVAKPANDAPQPFSISTQTAKGIQRRDPP